jgi:hypothetical protein
LPIAVTLGNVAIMIKSPAEIIVDKGGPAEFAAKVGKEANAVRLWKYRNRFPRNAWPEIIAAYPDLTLAMLKRVEAAQ